MTQRKYLELQITELTRLRDSLSKAKQWSYYYSYGEAEQWVTMAIASLQILHVDLSPVEGIIEVPPEITTILTNKKTTSHDTSNVRDGGTGDID